jgi:hypothetical protein
MDEFRYLLRMIPPPPEFVQSVANFFACCCSSGGRYLTITEAPYCYQAMHGAQFKEVNLKHSGIFSVRVHTIHTAIGLRNNPL